MRSCAEEKCSCGGGVTRELTSSAGPALVMLTPLCPHHDISLSLQHNFLNDTMIVKDEVVGLKGPEQAATRYFGRDDRPIVHVN
jgi:hypothetical protein